MELSPADRATLFEMGHSEGDFDQIEEATRKTTYEYRDKRIARKEAIMLLGRRAYLSGISRSAFHASAVRFTPKGEPVYFDSSRLFKA